MTLSPDRWVLVGADSVPPLGRYTALHFAACSGYTSIIYALLCGGADENIKNKNGYVRAALCRPQPSECRMHGSKHAAKRLANSQNNTKSSPNMTQRWRRCGATALPIACTPAPPACPPLAGGGFAHTSRSTLTLCCMHRPARFGVRRHARVQCGTLRSIHATVGLGLGMAVCRGAVVAHAVSGKHVFIYVHPHCDSTLVRALPTVVLDVAGERAPANSGEGAFPLRPLARSVGLCGAAGTHDRGTTNAAEFPSP